MMRLASWLLLGLLALGQIGCTCTPRAQARQVKVHLDEAVQADASRGLVEVDLVFVKDSELDDWRKMGENDIRRYFAGGGNLRDGADKYTATFAPDDDQPWERTRMQVEKSGFIEKNSMMHLVVLARMPRNSFQKAFVNLDKCTWKGAKPSWVDVMVGTEKLNVLPFTD